jgi:hypothetical protein
VPWLPLTVSPVVTQVKSATALFPRLYSVELEVVGWECTFRVAPDSTTTFPVQPVSGLVQEGIDPEAEIYACETYPTPYVLELTWSHWSVVPWLPETVSPLV